MRMHLKQYTEPIFSRLDDYRRRLAEHPLLAEARTGNLPTTILHEFAFHQYSDSILWIPMLAQMKSLAPRSQRLRQAIEDNIRHEAGIGGTSHVTLAVSLMRSLGIAHLDRFPTTTFAKDAVEWLSDDFVELTEPVLAGWLLTAESLVPLMFEAIEPCFAKLAADTTYFREHVSVDTDEHSRWMAEAVQRVLFGEALPLCGSNQSLPGKDWHRVQ